MNDFAMRLSAKEYKPSKYEVQDGLRYIDWDQLYFEFKCAIKSPWDIYCSHWNAKWWFHHEKTMDGYSEEAIQALAYERSYGDEMVRRRNADPFSYSEWKDQNGGRW